MRVDAQSRPVAGAPGSVALVPSRWRGKDQHGGTVPVARTGIAGPNPERQRRAAAVQERA